MQGRTDSACNYFCASFTTIIMMSNVRRSGQILPPVTVGYVSKLGPRKWWLSFLASLPRKREYSICPLNPIAGPQPCRPSETSTKPAYVPLRFAWTFWWTSVFIVACGPAVVPATPNPKHLSSQKYLSTFSSTANQPDTSTRAHGFVPKYKSVVPLGSRPRKLIKHLFHQMSGSDFVYQLSVERSFDKCKLCLPQAPAQPLAARWRSPSGHGLHAIGCRGLHFLTPTETRASPQRGSSCHGF